MRSPFALMHSLIVFRIDHPVEANFGQLVPALHQFEAPKQIDLHIQCNLVDCPHHFVSRFDGRWREQGRQILQIHKNDIDRAIL